MYSPPPAPFAIWETMRAKAKLMTKVIALIPPNPNVTMITERTKGDL